MTTLAPFAAAMATVNGGVQSMLADAEAVINGAAAVGVLFHEAYAVAGAEGLSFAGNAPAIELQTSMVPAQPRGKLVQLVSTLVGSRSFKIAEHHPDGAGWSVLILEVAS